MCIYKGFSLCAIDRIHLYKPVGAYMCTYMGLYLGVHILYIDWFASTRAA